MKLSERLPAGAREMPGTTWYRKFRPYPMPTNPRKAAAEALEQRGL